MLLLCQALSQSSDQLVHRGSNCFEVTQRAHSLEMERATVARRTGEIQARIESLAQSEAASEARLLDSTGDLKELRDLEAVLVGEIRGTQGTLERAQEHAMSLSAITNNTHGLIARKSRALAEVKEKIASDLMRFDDTESTMRNMELKIQMLTNDIDANNHTSMDMNRGAARARHDASVMSAQVGKLASEAAILQRAVDVASTRFQSASHDAQITRKQLVDLEEALYAMNQNREAKRMEIERQTSLVDSENVEIHTKQHGLRTLANTTLAEAETRIHQTSDRISGTQRSVNVIRDEILHLREISKRNVSVVTNSSDVPFSVDAARLALRQSRKFLSTQGYTSRFSLIESPTIGTEREHEIMGDDVRLLRDSSKLLTLEKELLDLTNERLRANETLRAAFSDMSHLKGEVGHLLAIERSDEEKLKADRRAFEELTTHITMTNSKIENIRKQMEVTARSLREEGDNLKKSRQDLGFVTHKLESANATLIRSLSVLHETENSLTVKFREIDGLKKQRASFLDSERTAEGDLAQLHQDVESLKNTSRVLTTDIRKITDQLEANRKSHLESLADVAQMSRRLDEQLQKLQELKERIRRNQLEVNDLAASVRTSLNERGDLNHDLSLESERREQLESMWSDVNRQLREFRCDR